MDGVSALLLVVSIPTFRVMFSVKLLTADYSRNLCAQACALCAVDADQS